ncbi:Uncharacterised protein [Mycobacteroides abscessus subsp. abscessus]|nr:Uncharacterised protein [Mycobacteroides abscessus subsp. abscessus]
MHSMRSGASGRPRWSWISLSAALRVVRSEERLSLCWTSASFAFFVTVSSTAFFSPRSGTRTLTFEPRCRLSQLSRESRSAGIVSTRISLGIASASRPE